MKLYIDIKSSVFDASGIQTPEMYYWDKSGVLDVFYPIRKISEEEAHEEIRSWLDTNGFPPVSLDEIPLADFTPEKLIYRDFLMDLLEIINHN
jgi:hypothetical protein